VKAALSALEKPEGKKLDSADKRVFVKALNSVKKFLNNMEITKAKKIIKELEKKELDGDTEELLEMLSQNILMFEYDEAVELIGSFVKEAVVDMRCGMAQAS